jgi:hemoglobin
MSLISQREPVREREIMTTAEAPRKYGLAMTEAPGVPHEDAGGITEEVIRRVVVEFYRRARLDARIGPKFERHVHDWDFHLDRMTDFWSAALLRTGRYSGNPIQRHMGVDGLNRDDFDRWISLFEDTVRDLCPGPRADAFLGRAVRMRAAMTKMLALNDRTRWNEEDRTMNADSKRLIVLASSCQACDVHTIRVHHQNFPELQLEGMTAAQAADHLANRLTTSLDSISDPTQSAAVRAAVADIRAFIDREGAVHPGRDV